MKLIIPGELPSLNEIIKQSRTHWSVDAKRKKHTEADIAVLIRQQKLKPVPSPVWITYTWYCPNKRKDPSNIAAGGRKVIEDALVSCGIIAGDGWKDMKGFFDTFWIDKYLPRVEVTIQTWEKP